MTRLSEACTPRCAVFSKEPSDAPSEATAIDASRMHQRTKAFPRSFVPRFEEGPSIVAHIHILKLRIETRAPDAPAMRRIALF